jgi:hypothetical protein
VYIVLQSFFHYKGKMRAFGAVAIIVLPFIAVLFNSIVEHLLGLPYLHTNFGQICQLHWSPILFNEMLKVQSVEIQIRILGFKTFLGEVERLLHQIGVGIVHWALWGVVLDEQ